MRVSVRKRNGSQQTLNVNKLAAQAERACEGLVDVSADNIISETVSQLYDGITTEEISQALILTTRAKIEQEPNYSYVAARILLNKLYKEAFGCTVNQVRIDEQYRGTFVENIHTLVKVKRLSKRLLNLDLESLAASLKPERDYLFKYLGLQTLYDRYFLHTNGRRLETPQAFWMRVAMGIALREKEPERYAIEFYEVMSQFKYLPGTPTLFNSGTRHPQLSSCYLSTMDDSIDGIYGTIHDQARLSKYAGGIGLDVTPLRATGGFIHSTNGLSSGLIPWLKNVNDMLVAVNQGGKRKGAGCVYTEPWHPDIEQFIDLRKNTGDERRRCHDMNTALWIPDEFLHRAWSDKDWYLFSPDECPNLHKSFGEDFVKEYEKCIQKAEAGELHVWRKVSAKELYKKILRAAFETGHPWVCFKDASNACYMQIDEGLVNSSNLCTEILRHTLATLYDRWARKKKIGETAVCNLGSINAGVHVVDSEIDKEDLAKTTCTAVRMLDNVIDENYYPILEAKKSNMRHRPVGLGLMGFVDLLRKFDIPYDSTDAVKLADNVQEFISYHAILASTRLAEERGPFKTYSRSEWAKGLLPLDKWQQFMLKYRGVVDTTTPTQNWSLVRERIAQFGIRNASIQAIAPTATISYIAGCKQSIEPDIGVLFVYSTLSGEFTMIDEYFVNQAKELGIWGPELVDALKQVDGDVSKLRLPERMKRQFASAFSIDYRYLMDAAAARQKWIDMGQSMNLYCDKPSLKYLDSMYRYSFEKGLKTTYYLRSRGASQVEKSSVSHNGNGKSVPEEQYGTVCKMEPGCQSCQ